MQDWATEVDAYLTAKHQLDRRKVQRAQPANQATGGPDR
ncbi:MAG: hypothetical protein OJF50_003846 [Nitrospira sp.]|nr:hypothetical protein [Nitrospira sp.]